MTHQPSDAPVRVTGEERLHPALRKLGRACIALARWQREQQQRPPNAPSGDAASSNTGIGTNPTTTTPTTPAQEPHHD